MSARQPCRRPRFLERTATLLEAMRSMSFQQLQELWGCNDRLASQNWERVRHMELDRNLTPAALAYVGLQYTHMGPGVLEQQAWDYLCDNLRILSGFYGILRADDGVACYRLEMQAPLAAGGSGSLYDFWGRSIYDELTAQDKVILNLASKEYSKAVEPYLEEGVRYVTCVFACGSPEKHRVKATEAKMCRGSMARWCAVHNAKRPEEVQAFDDYGYRFSAEGSDENTYLFLK